MPDDVAAVNVACYRKPVVTVRSAQESHSGTFKQRHSNWRIGWARKVRARYDERVHTHRAGEDLPVRQLTQSSVEHAHIVCTS